MSHAGFRTHHQLLAAMRVSIIEIRFMISGTRKTMAAAHASMAEADAAMTEAALAMMIARLAARQIPIRPSELMEIITDANAAMSATDGAGNHRKNP